MITLPRDEQPEDELMEEFLPGLPRQCKHCGTWERYEKPSSWKRGDCFSVTCPFCYKSFDVIPNMKGARQ